MKMISESLEGLDDNLVVRCLNCRSVNTVKGYKENFGRCRTCQSSAVRKLVKKPVSHTEKLA